jgi:hypothetical protein
MRSLSVTGDSLRSMLRLALLLVGLATYLVTPDDMVWQFVKSMPQARLLEHLAFGFAAILIGVALLLKIQASASITLSPTKTMVANVLQAAGIGSLLPLPGFLLLVFGDLSISLLSRERQSAIHRNAYNVQSTSWTDAIAEHIGLCCAFASMMVFTIVLIDIVADALFVSSAIVSLLASARRALSSRPSSR